MKLHHRLFLSAFALVSAAISIHAGEPGLVLSYQPLDGQGSGELQIMPVTCHNMHGHSPYPSEVSLIAAKNIPPNNSNQELFDHNLASQAGIRIDLEDDPKGGFTITLDLTELNVTEDFLCTPEELIAATLECIRKTLGTPKYKYTLRCKTKDHGQEKLQKIVERYQKHPKNKPFPWQAVATQVRGA